MWGPFAGIAVKIAGTKILGSAIDLACDCSAVDTKISCGSLRLEHLKERGP
jgi:hypothetical protein